MKKNTPRNDGGKAVRKNITLPPDVVSMLEKQASAEFTTASALLARYVIEKDSAQPRPIRTRRSVKPKAEKSDRA